MPLSPPHSGGSLSLSLLDTHVCLHFHTCYRHTGLVWVQMEEMGCGGASWHAKALLDQLLPSVPAPGLTVFLTSGEDLPSESSLTGWGLEELQSA